MRARRAGNLGRRALFLQGVALFVFPAPFFLAWLLAYAVFAPAVPFGCLRMKRPRQIVPEGLLKIQYSCSLASTATPSVSHQTDGADANKRNRRRLGH